MRTRAEHLSQCKQRALKYIDRHEIQEGLTSMFSDLTKHPETDGHAGIGIGVKLMAIGSLNTQDDARRFIEGFN